MNRRTRTSGMTLIELLVVIAVSAVLIGLLLTAVQAARQASLRVQCANNLHQIGLALHIYHDTHGMFPPGCSYQNGASPYPHMSWMTRLLPYVEQDSLWQEALQAFSQEKFFELGPHLRILGTVMRVYSCPSDPRTLEPATVAGLPGYIQVALTSYLGVDGIDHTRHDGVLFLDSRIRFTDILDGTSNTLMAGERPPSADLIYGWWYAGWGQDKDGSLDLVLGAEERNDSSRPVDCPAGPYAFGPGSIADQCDAYHFWSLHPGGANFLFCDGSVHFLSYGAAKVLPALATRAGGEPVGIPD